MLLWEGPFTSFSLCLYSTSVGAALDSRGVQSSSVTGPRDRSLRSRRNASRARVVLPPAVPSISPGEKWARSRRTCRRRGFLAEEAEAAGDGLAEGAAGLAKGGDGLIEGDGVGAWSGDSSALGDASAGVASGTDGDAEA